MYEEGAAGEAVSSAEWRSKLPGTRALWGYRVLAVGSALALVVVCYSGPLPKDSGSPTPAFVPVVCCIAVLGIAYYLGRTRRLAQQQLNLAGKVLSVIPIVGLIFIPSMGGLSRLTRRRLYLRNVAIFAATALIQLSSDGLDERSLPATTLAVCLLCLVTPVLAVVLSRRTPAITTAAPPGGTGPTGNTPAETGRPTPAPSTAAVNPDLPAPSQVLDVTAASTLARRLYWLSASMKFGAIFVALGILAPNGPLQLSWAGGIVACAAVVVGCATAVLLQEDRLRPVPAVSCGLALMSAVCFIPAAFGVITGAAATAVFGWAICVLPFLWLYRRQRRSSGLRDADVQAMSRVGHLPPPTGGSAAARRPLPPRATWLRGSTGLVLAPPLVLLGLVNTFAGMLVFSDWIQAPLDKLYALARRQAGLLFSSAGPRQPAIAVAASAEPEAWKLVARGDLLHWGRVGAQRVGFEEFLETRLEPYGELQTIDEACRRDPAAAAVDNTSLVVTPVGAPLEDEVIDKVAGLAARLPVLLVPQPVRTASMLGWAELAGRFQARHLTLPVLAEPMHTMAVLHLATGENLVYLAQKRNQWGYVAAIHAALVVLGIATAQHRASNPPVLRAFRRPGQRKFFRAYQRLRARIHRDTRRLLIEVPPSA